MLTNLFLDAPQLNGSVCLGEAAAHERAKRGEGRSAVNYLYFIAKNVAPKRKDFHSFHLLKLLLLL